jgi:putative hemolysin
VTLFLQLLAVAGLLLLNALFVAAEYALVTARRTRITELRDQGNRRARVVLRITANPARFIAAMQLGVTITSLGVGAVGEPVFARIFDPIPAVIISYGLAFLLITYLHVVIGELIPKGVALGHSETVALALSTPVSWFFVAFKPLIWVLEKSSDWALRALGLEPPGEDRGAPYSEAELKMLLSRSTESGELEAQEQEMLYKVFDFADKEVSDVMVPRPQVVALSVDLPPEECLAAVIDSPFTRYPVYRETLDNVVGILHVRDLFSALRERGMHEVRVEDLVRPAHIVPETKDLAALLAEFRRANQHMAIVVDEYGDMEGIVTLEDLLEEIVGEIEDEFDLPDESIEQVDDDTVIIDGTFPIDDFNERFKTDLPVEDYHTMAGFVFGLLGRQPEQGDDVSHDGMRFDVMEVTGSRILKLAVTFEQRRDQRDRDDTEHDELEAELFDVDN